MVLSSSVDTRSLSGLAAVGSRGWEVGYWVLPWFQCTSAPPVHWCHGFWFSALLEASCPDHPPYPILTSQPSLSQYSDSHWTFLCLSSSFVGRVCGFSIPEGLLDWIDGRGLQSVFASSKWYDPQHPVLLLLRWPYWIKYMLLQKKTSRELQGQSKASFLIGCQWCNDSHYRHKSGYSSHCFHIYFLFHNRKNILQKLPPLSGDFEFSVFWDLPSNTP